MVSCKPALGVKKSFCNRSNELIIKDHGRDIGIIAGCGRADGKDKLMFGCNSFNLQ